MMSSLFNISRHALNNTFIEVTYYIYCLAYVLSDYPAAWVCNAMKYMTVLSICFVVLQTMFHNNSETCNVCKWLLQKILHVFWTALEGVSENGLCMLKLFSLNQRRHRPFSIWEWPCMKGKLVTVPALITYTLHQSHVFFSIHLSYPWNTLRRWWQTVIN